MNNENITIQRIYEESCKISDGEGLFAPLGIKENGEIEYVDYSKINHLIVCGTSGSGKTTFVRTLLTSLMSVSSPKSLKFAIYDSKSIDYIDFNGMPFLLIPVSCDSRKCPGMIYWALIEAKRRQKFFTDFGGVDKYTKMVDEHPDMYSEIPEIFIVLDDYAEVVNEPDAQESLYELLQIAHRVKIHVIIVTTIALAKIISTEIKIHIPHRISFYLPERRNSQVVIDQDGAETLDFPGEFIAKFYNKTKTLHSIELSDLEIEEFFDFAKTDKECDNHLYKQIFSNWHSSLDEIATEYDQDIMDEVDKNSSFMKHSFHIEDLEELDDDDPLYDAAVEVVLEVGQVSTSLLQRRLKLSYACAERIINEMVRKGFIRSFNGAKPREVLMNKEPLANEPITDEPKNDKPVAEESKKEESITEEQPLNKHHISSYFGSIKKSNKTDTENPFISFFKDYNLK